MAELETTQVAGSTNSEKEEEEEEEGEVIEDVEEEEEEEDFLPDHPTLQDYSKVSFLRLEAHPRVRVTLYVL